MTKARISALRTLFIPEDAAEALAVDGAAAVRAKRRPVLARAVADVAVEAVFGELPVVLAHERVAVGLGEDGGGGDGGRDRVAADDGALGQRRLAQLERVYQKKIGARLKLL